MKKKSKYVYGVFTQWSDDFAPNLKLNERLEKIFTEKKKARDFCDSHSQYQLSYQYVIKKIKIN